MLTPDKIGHIKAGAGAAAFGMALGALVGLLAGPVLICVGTAALAASTSAGITKEMADRADNSLWPGAHSVDPIDALATAAPGLLVCVACLLVAGVAW